MAHKRTPQIILKVKFNAVKETPTNPAVIREQWKNKNEN